MSEKVSSILVLTEIEETTVQEAKRIFYMYREDRVIDSICVFGDDVWKLTNETEGYTFNFSIDERKFERFSRQANISVELFKEYMKTFIVCKMGELSLDSLRQIIYYIKKTVYADSQNIQSMIKEYNARMFGHTSEFLSMISKDENNGVVDYVNMLDVAEDFARGTGNGQRSLAMFQSYFVFDDIIKDYWKTADNKEEKLFFFPVWLWWNLSGVLPLRPCEFVLTPRNCIKMVDGKYYLTVRRNKIKGSGKTKSYKISRDYRTVEYTIPESLAREIMWYQEETKLLPEANTHTLFVTDTHYAKWDRHAPYTSRYYSYINLGTCLRYFFEQIIRDRYGFTILYEDTNESDLADKTIEYLHLGDTRHLALINMIFEGSTPMVAMMLAGHDNPDMSAHYYSNIATLVECRTYRQYKKQIKGKQNYTLSGPHEYVRTHVRTQLDKGWCISEKVAQEDFSDCRNVIGPAGEIGFCQRCKYYRDEARRFNDEKEMHKNEIEAECHNLERIVNLVRKGEGDREDILSSLMRLRDKEYSYQEYLRMGIGKEHHAKTEND